jgi:hypothetical protein
MSQSLDQEIVWEVSGDMWDHWNKISTSTIIPTKLCEIKTLNIQITGQFEDGPSSMSQHKDHHHWLENCILTFSSTT